MKTAGEVFRSFIETFQNSFPPSVNVDFLLFLCGKKHSLRTQPKNRLDLPLFNQWSQQWGYTCSLDPDNYFYLSTNSDLLTQVRTLDHSVQSHERELGQLLGYPICCCEKIAEVGEGHIDAFERTYSSQKFWGPFRLIDPRNYQKGKSFSAHIPCSTTCVESLKQAETFVHFLLKNRQQKVFQPWFIELARIYGDQNEYIDS